MRLVSKRGLNEMKCSYCGVVNNKRKCIKRNGLSFCCVECFRKYLIDEVVLE